MYESVRVAAGLSALPARDCMRANAPAHRYFPLRV